MVVGIHCGAMPEIAVAVVVTVVTTVESTTTGASVVEAVTVSVGVT